VSNHDEGKCNEFGVRQEAFYHEVDRGILLTDDGGICVDHLPAEGFILGDIVTDTYATEE